VIFGAYGFGCRTIERVVVDFVGAWDLFAMVRGRQFRATIGAHRSTKIRERLADEKL